MATYVMSDIHGMYDDFIQMLKLIKFNDKDELYILGDILDRGEKPIDILEYIIAKSNIHLILGNHEQMMLNWYNFGDNCWIAYNGGNTTFQQLQEYQLKGKINYVDAVIQYLCTLPLYKIIEVNKKNFILIHADIDIPVNDNIDLKTLFHMQSRDILLWSRSNINKENTFKDYTVIHGHTPVQNIEKNNKGTIIKKNGHIYIDCGACFNNGQLGCLKLDNMKEFYV